MSLIIGSKFQPSQQVLKATIKNGLGFLPLSAFNVTSVCGLVEATFKVQLSTIKTNNEITTACADQVKAKP